MQRISKTLKFFEHDDKKLFWRWKFDLSIIKTDIGTRWF